jgi:putative ABC transport system permease protein
MPTFREWLRAARLVFNRGNVERELDDELRFHLEMETRRNIERGMPPLDARALAEREFGGVGRVKNELTSVHSVAGVSVIESIMTDLRYTLRGLRLAPGFTAGAVVTLALGIGANVTMFAMLHRLLLRSPAHVADPDRVVNIIRHVKTAQYDYNTNSFSYPRFKALREALVGAEEVAAVDTPRDMPFGRGTDARNVKGTLVSGNYFTLLGTRPQLGRFFHRDEDHEPIGEPVVVISDGLWKRVFDGDRNVLGRTMEIGTRRFSIIGVAPPEFTGFHTTSPDVWIPVSSGVGLQFPGQDWATTKNSTWLYVLARMKPGVSTEQLGAQSDVGIRASAIDPNAKLTSTPVIQRLADYQRESRGADAKVTILLASVSLLVLLIACANLANLLLARSLRRRREIAVRIALGASRGRLAAQIATESLVLAVIGGIASLAVAQWGGAVVARQLFADAVWASSPVDRNVVAYTLGIILFAAAVSAIVPALQTSRPELTSALKAGVRGGSERARTRNLLLVLQATLSVLLLVGAGLFVRSLRNVTSLDVGMDLDHALLATMDLKKLGLRTSEVHDLYERMAERVRAIPGVEKAAVAVTVPSYHSYGTSVHVPGRDSIPNVEGPYINGVQPDYFAALGLRIVRGRAFTDVDVRAGERVVVINETLARMGWPNRDPIGQCVKIGGDTMPCTTVVGVAADSRRQNYIEDPSYLLHVPVTQTNQWMDTRVLLVRMKGERRPGLFNEIGLAMQTTASRLPYAFVRPLAAHRFDAELRPWRLGATMFGAFGVLALLLAGVGLYSVIAFSVARRTHELGVRMALGAEARDVVRMVLRQAFILATLGAIAGVVLALGGGRFIQPLLFQTSARDPVVFATVVAVILGVSIVAALLPALRATRVDPVTALRTE